MKKELTKTYIKNFAGKTKVFEKNPFEVLDELSNSIKKLSSISEDMITEAERKELSNQSALFTTLMDVVLEELVSSFEATEISKKVLSKNINRSMIEPTIVEVSYKQSSGNEKKLNFSYNTTDTLAVNSEEIISKKLVTADGKPVTNHTQYYRYCVENNLPVPSYFKKEEMIKFKPALAKVGDEMVQASKELNEYFNKK